MSALDTKRSALDLAGLAVAEAQSLDFGDRELTFDEWTAVGQRLARVVHSAQWWIGDWLFYGQQEHADANGYTQALDEAAVITGLDRETLMNYALIAGRFAVARRRANLSFSHHAEVLALRDYEEQDEWLEKAARFGWSRNEMRDRIRESRQLTPRPQGITPLRLTFAVEPDREQRWRTAAEREGLPLHEWAANILDAAA